jgi:hypothetical protein
MRAIYLAHIILVNIVLLTIFGEEQQLWILIIQFAPVSSYFLPVMSKYSPQHTVLKHPTSVQFS